MHSKSQDSGLYVSQVAPVDRKVRFEFIDVLRGIAAVAVLISHGIKAAGLASDDGFGAKWINLGEFGVITFFLVSGFVIPLSLERANSLKKFWINRIFRIWPLYLIILFLTYASFRSGPFTPEGYDADIGLAHIIPAHLLFFQQYLNVPDYVGGSWTLSVEMVWYIVFSGFFLLGFHRREILVSILAGFALLTICILALHISTRLPMGRFSMLVMCTIGWMFYRFHEGLTVPGRFHLIVALLAATVGFALYVGFELVPSPGSPIIFRCVAISWSSAFVFFIVGYFLRHSRIMGSRLLLRLGTYSYSIYLVHGITIYWLEASKLEGWIFMAALLVTTLPLAWLTYTYVERPAMNLAKRLYVSEPRCYQRGS